MSDARLFHITTAAEVEAARATGAYRPAAFDREGFIHCSYGRQVAATAERIFRGRAGLVVLEIDRAAVGCPVVDENLEGGRELFPHIYGPLPLAAVRAVHELALQGDGSFHMPAAITAG